MKILILHGINLDMFGKREPAKYGTTTLAEIDAQLVSLGKELGAELSSFQSNHEGALCERIHEAFSADIDAIVINAGRGPTTATAWRDALAMVTVPIVEVHMSNIRARTVSRSFGPRVHCTRADLRLWGGQLPARPGRGGRCREAASEQLKLLRPSGGAASQSRQKQCYMYYLVH